MEFEVESLEIEGNIQHAFKVLVGLGVSQGDALN
jgi:hypothetical protein